MSFQLLHPDEYEIVARSSIDSDETFNLDEADFVARGPKTGLVRGQTILSRLFTASLPRYRCRKSRARWSRPQRCSYPRLTHRRICSILSVLSMILVAAIILTYLFYPSYTRLPPHYQALRDEVLQSSLSGRGNLRNEKVFIAASLYDRGGKIVRGQWGRAVLDLIDMIGEDNVFLSIYENDGGETGHHALLEFSERVKCNKSIAYERHFDFSQLPTVVLPDGSRRIKRIAFLAEVRNRALRPLDDELSGTRYDRVLYLNDVIFDPLDALQLLFSTNIDHSGVARYRAACAVDFINAFKFYDTFATRDMHGYSMGLPFFPWFSSAGSGQTRLDVLDEKDAVRVRSCWGGMVAFDARFLQKLASSSTNSQSPSPTVKWRPFQSLEASPINPVETVRFRFDPDLFWESSESCLIHADIQEDTANIDEVTDSGIYLNPFIRTAYDARSHSWLWTTRRFEKLYPVVHDIISRLRGLPTYNPRRTEIAGQQTKYRVWVNSNQSHNMGSFVTVNRTATKGGFCASQDLQVINEDRQGVEDGWESIPIPHM